jgi:ATP-dependent Clp protease ATP-binding subunit ClpA
MSKVMTLEMLATMSNNKPEKTLSLAQEHAKKVSNETDEEIIERLRQRFDILDDMTRACKAGKVRAMIVTGPPGVGKSFGVEKVLAKHDVFADVANDSKLKKYEVVKGAMSQLLACTRNYTSSAIRSQSLCSMTATAFCLTT